MEGEKRFEENIGHSRERDKKDGKQRIMWEDREGKERRE